MTTQAECSDLVDIAGVAAMLGITPTSARTLIGRSARGGHPFPEPCVRLGGRPGWQIEDVREWISARPGAGRGPRPNRRLSDVERMYSMARGKDYLSVAQTAKLLRVELDTFRRLPRTKRPKETKAGNSWIRFQLDDVLAFLESRKAA